MFAKNEAAKTPSSRRMTGRSGMASGLISIMVAVMASLNGRSLADESTKQPAGSPKTDVRLELDRYEVWGNTLLPKDGIVETLAPYLGTVDLETVKNARDALQMAYRDRGYATVAVTIPPQSVTNGVLRIDVIEGKVVEIKVVNNRYFSSNNIMRSLPGRFTDAVLDEKIFQTQVDWSNANPDRQIYPEVRKGPEPGTSALVLDIKDRLPLHGRAEINNASTPGSSDLRANVNVSYDNLWQREHSIGFQYGFTPDTFKPNTDLEHFPLIALDAPQIANYSAFYRAPLAGPPTVESQVAADPTRFGYSEVSHKFIPPAQSGRPELTIYGSRSTTSDGRTPPLTLFSQTDLETIYTGDYADHLSQDDAGGTRLSLPLPPFLGIQSRVSTGLDIKRHATVTLATNSFVFSSVLTNTVNGYTIVTNIVSSTSFPNDTSESSVAYLPLFFGWDGARPDKWGQTSGGLSLTVGMGHPFDGAQDFADMVGTKEADGKFVVLHTQLAREQRLPGNWVVRANAAGQWASEPLLTVEQFGLGGLSSVRGYKEGERYGDNGWTTQFELITPTRWASPNELNTSFSVFTRLRPKLFPQSDCDAKEPGPLGRGHRNEPGFHGASHGACCRFMALAQQLLAQGGRTACHLLCQRTILMKL
jgi:hemolysin activation/secretion protein